MSDKQTTSMLLLLLTAFVFWLYNSKSADGTTSKLKTIVDEVRGITTKPNENADFQGKTSEALPTNDFGFQPSRYAVTSLPTNEPTVKSSTLNSDYATSGLSLDFFPPVGGMTSADIASVLGGMA